MAGAMIYVHEVHEVLGGKMEEFGDAVCREWRPLVEDGDRARLLWFWQLTHGTGASYQAVSITAVRDWATWGELVGDPRLRVWRQRGWALRREVTAKVLLPVACSPRASRPPGPGDGWRKGCATAIAGSRSCSAAPGGRRDSKPTRDPCLGSRGDSERAARVHRANGVPRPAERL